jgi:hypothetical protein
VARFGTLAISSKLKKGNLLLGLRHSQQRLTSPLLTTYFLGGEVYPLGRYEVSFSEPLSWIRFLRNTTENDCNETPNLYYYGSSVGMYRAIRADIF